MTYEENKIREAIGMALKDLDMQPTDISDAAFHMTDWLGDQKEWSSLCEKPESLTREEIQELLMGFLVHVPNHVAATLCPPPPGSQTRGVFSEFRTKRKSPPFRPPLPNSGRAVWSTYLEFTVQVLPDIRPRTPRVFS